MNSNRNTKPATTQLSLHEALPVGSVEKAELRAKLEPRKSHGGLPAIGKRKTSRPFQAKAPLHLVLRSSRAKGMWSLKHRRNESRVARMVYGYAERYQIKVYRSSNTGREIHLLIKANERKQLADFLRVLAGRVAVTVTGAQRGVKKIGKFWEHLCFSRLINWGAEFHGVRQFVKTVINSEFFDENDEFYWKKIPNP